jgi:hypothetical protein
MVATIGFEHPLHDDLAPLVLEIDVDIGRLAQLFRNEPFEQQIVAFRIDGRDAEDIADGGIRGGAATLTENVLAGAKRTMEFTVRKYGAYCSDSISRSSCFKVATTLSGTPSG